MLFNSIIFDSMSPVVSLADRAGSDGSPHDLLPLSPLAFSILVALIEGDLHGYGIAKRIAERDAGAVTLAPGNLYSAIDRLVAAKLVTRSRGAAAGRRTYSVTPLGREVAGLEAARLDALVRTARRLSILPSGRSK